MFILNCALISLSLMEQTVLKLEQIFQKNKVVTREKTPLLVIGPFYSRHSICLNIGF